MSSTYTPSNGIQQPATGDLVNTWGTAVNNNMELIDQSLDGFVNIVLSSSSANLTVTQGASSNGRNRVIEFSGSPTGTVAVTVSPSNISKVFWIVNSTSQSLSITNGSGSSYSVPANTTAPAFCDGAGNVTGLQAGNSVFSALTAGTLNVTGTSSFGGVLTADSANVVFGAPSTVLLNSGSTNLTAYITSLIPSLTSLTGTLVVSNISVQAVTGGAWVIFTFGTTAGTRIQIAFGAGTSSVSGSTISLPSGSFSFSNTLSFATLGAVASSTGNQLQSISVSINSSGVLTMSASDQSGHTYVVTATWFAVSWVSGV